MVKFDTVPKRTSVFIAASKVTARNPTGPRHVRELRAVRCPEHFLDEMWSPMPNCD